MNIKNKKIVINIENTLFNYYKKHIKKNLLQSKLLEEIELIDIKENAKIKKESFYLDKNIIDTIDEKLNKSQLNISRTMFINMTILNIYKENYKYK